MIRRSDERLTSAYNLIFAVLHAEGVSDTHKKEFIRLALWKVTEAHGTKYNTGFESVGARAIRASGDWSGLRHEHVITRASVCQALMKLKREGEAGDDRVREILDLCVACVVTDEEHDRLNNSRVGWLRYAHAEPIVVVFRDNGGQAVNLDAEGRKQEEVWRRIKG